MYFQVFGTVPTISIDKTDGCQMFLSNDSLGVEIVSSKSSEMNVLVPKSNGDYVSNNNILALSLISFQCSYYFVTVLHLNYVFIFRVSMLFLNNIKLL